ncbi:MAG: hypothetical protein IJ123_09695 [Blautia sp.]|nr:hypothetical protein [Blautia sp.]
MFDVKVTTSKASSDCGAACMVSFLAYYGKNVSLDEIRKECIKVQGASGKDLLICGRKRGLDMIPWKEKWVTWLEGKEDGETTDVEIFNQDRPAICLWEKRHWIIYCGMDDKDPDRVVIMNPSRGRFSIDKSLFESFYSGVFLTDGIPQELPKTPVEGVPETAQEEQNDEEAC